MIRVLWQELTFGLHGTDQLAHVVIRLLAATLLGGLVGIQRESTRKPAGLRTHVLVSVASAAFIVACTGSGMSSDGISRVIQGIVTGIGFLGAGTILKLSHEHEIKGLTTAASVWMTAAIGVIVGLGSLGIALIVTSLALIILSLARLEHSIEGERRRGHEHEKDKAPEKSP
jgi:putative Mg2+ transporter-C (MgtC) family protein